MLKKQRFKKKKGSGRYTSFLNFRTRVAPEPNKDDVKKSTIMEKIRSVISRISTVGRSRVHAEDSSPSPPFAQSFAQSFASPSRSSRTECSLKFPFESLESTLTDNSKLNTTRGRFIG